MVATSTKEPARFTPAWLCDAAGAPKPGAPVFLIRVADVIERGLFEAELAGEYRAERVWPFELRDAAERGLRELLDGLHLDRALELCAANFKLELADGPDREAWSHIEDALNQAGGEFAALSGRAARRATIIPTAAAARFVCGWENVTSAETGEPLEFALGRDGRVDRDVLAAVNGLELEAVGKRAYELQYLRSSRPLSPRSRSDAARGTSTSGAKTLGARRGNSRGSSSRKTRG